MTTRHGTRTKWPGVYRRETKAGVVFDAVASIHGRQKWSYSHPSPAAALQAKEGLRQQLEPGAAALKARSVLGKRFTPTHKVWSNMIQRCTNPNNPWYPYYGGRGITICDRWLMSFDAFYEDMGEKPVGLSLDRINNDEGYEPNNCRWATASAQNRNKQKLRFGHP